MKELLNELNNYIEEINQKFIISHLGVMNPPQIYKIDVFSYCVLGHAAIENYLEKIALYLMTKSIENCQKNNYINMSLLSLVGQSNTRLLETPDIKLITEGKLNYFPHYFEKFITKIKNEFSTLINNNHGINLEYIYKILLPLGINIPIDPNIINSLDKLSKSRGEYAHKSPRFIKKILVPEDALIYVNDCIKLCENINQQVCDIIDLETDILYYSGNDYY